MGFGERTILPDDLPQKLKIRNNCCYFGKIIGYLLPSRYPIVKFLLFKITHMVKKLLKINLLLVLAVLINKPVYAQCTFSGLNANYCTNSATSSLTAGVGGGAFSGPGITGSVFSPSLAGPGTHTINYNVCSTTYSLTTPTFSPILSATVGTSETLSDDAVTGSIAIGFNFKFFCNTYTNYYISSNGFITFNAASGNGCCQGLAMPTLGNPDNMIAYAWTDLYPPAGGSITHTLIGTAPNRIQVISFNSINHYNGGSSNACCPITAQILLYETTNVIEIHTTTKPLPTGSSTYSTTMGIQNLGASVAYTVAGRNASPTWTASNECQRWTPGASCNVNQTTVVSPSTISVVGNSSICIGSTASLTATGNTTYTWSTTSNSNSITVTPSANQTYTVSGTNSFGCIANSAITVTVDQTPTVTAMSSSGSAGICPGRTVSLSGVGATSYSWTGGISNGIPFTISATSNYVVTGSNACGSSTAAVSLSIHPTPSVTAVASTASLCSGNTLTLTGVGNATAYAWSGGTIPITNGTGFAPLLTNTYTVIGTSALSCTALATVPVTVVNTPTAFPTAQPALICIGNSSTLTATGATSYTWAGPTSTVFTSTVAVTPNVGSTTYTITKSNSNCVDTKTINVVTNALPVIFAIVTPTLVCASNPASLAVGGGQSYTWTAPGPPTYTFSGASPVVSPPVSSIYTVAASDGTCINTTTVYLATNPNPTITVSATTPSVCNGQTVGMTANGAINYTWTATTGTFFTPTIVGTPSIATSYNVSGDNSFGCVSGANQIVLVYQNPTITVSATKTLVCNNGASTLTAGGAHSYTWDPNANGALTAGTIVNPGATTSGPVIYTVQGSYTTTGCSSTKTVQVSVFIPTLTVTGNTNTCAGGLISLTASGGNNNTYSWNTGIGNPYNFPSISTTLAASATWTVSANTSSASVICPSSKTVALGIYFNPTITAVAQRTTICRTETVNLIGNGGVSYVWNNNMTGGTITVNPNTNTTYTVTGTDANGCVNTGTVQVKVSGCTGINELQGLNTGILIYPNPNTGDFMIELDPATTGLDITLTLVNEIGQIVRIIKISESNHKVSITDLAKGIYFITGKKENILINQKVVVTN